MTPICRAGDPARVFQPTTTKGKKTMESLTEKILDAIATLEAQIAADMIDIQRSRNASDPEKIAIHAGEMAANAVRLEVFNQVTVWMTEQEQPQEPKRTSGPLAMAAAIAAAA